MKNFKLLSLITIILSGCGSGTDTQTNNEIESNTNRQITGKVVDGEISGATVFLDLNKNGNLDSSEPKTLTKSDGSYILTLRTKDREHQNYLNKTAPLVAYGGTDIRNKEAFEDYLMAMLEEKNQINITPFTTLITQSLEEENAQISKTINKTDAEIATELAKKIAEIKKNLAELFGLNESILDKDPIQLAKEGDNSLLSQSLQLHQSAKTMKKAMKGDTKDLAKSILKSYRSLGRELKKLKRDALKNKDEALLQALDTAMDDSELFDSNLVAEVKKETKAIVVSINEFWKGQEGTLTDNALSDAIQEGESIIDTVIGTDIGTGDSTDAGTDTGTGTPIDTTKPIITLSGSPTVTLLQGSVYNDAGATASDDVDGDLTSSITVVNSVNTNSIGNYSITYNVSDSSGNRAVQVIRTVTVNPQPVVVTPDTTKPIITLIGESNITLIQGTVYTEAGATALDNIDGNITSRIQINNSVDTSSEGIYTVTYDVNDSSGNGAIQIIRTVNVIVLDTTIPTITLLGESNITLVQGTPYIDAGATANDDRDGNVTSIVRIRNMVDVYRAGTYYITYDVRDSAGNSATQGIRMVTVTPFVETNLSVSRTDALKFLRQASFRSSEEEIFSVMANGYEAWIDNQFAMVGDTDSDTDTKYDYLESTLRTMNRYNPALYPLSVATDPTTLDEEILDGQRIGVFRNSVFWDKALNDENQLRQRVAYALSQILVVADISPVGKALSFRGESLIEYYDNLYKHSFGNYRDLLTDVTYSSAMGYFLTYIGSRATAPDENYARELTQLFTVGLYELNDDGTKQLSGGNPVPAYDQQHVTDLSKVFTGWGLEDLQGDEPRYGGISKVNFSWVSPLKFSSQYHDSNSTLDLLGSATMTTTPDGSADIETALNILFANHNVAPHISRHLIMRLVTSNPTPAYVGRVAAVFNNNGAGVKGDLKAVVKAILLDPEARGTTVVPNFGKVDEMFVAMGHILSQLKAKPAPILFMPVRVSLGVFETQEVSNMYWLDSSREFGQTPLGAPSVFNFYSNEFIPSSSYFANNSLVSPELEIQTISNLINYSNLLDRVLTLKEKYSALDMYAFVMGRERTIAEWSELWPFYTTNQGFYFDLTEEYNVFEKALDNEIIANGDFANMGDGSGANVDRTRAVNALLEHLDEKFFGGTMPQAYKDALLLHTESFDYPRYPWGRAGRVKAIVTTLVRAIITSPLYMVLK